jgi:hypothetical protein
MDFHAEADDPAVPDLGPDPTSPPKSAEEIEAERMLHERIVELCSAANIVEAEGLCELLEEAGIQARAVGDELGIAAGMLPLGEATTPRIWVCESDETRAREVIAQWRKALENEPVEPFESEESEEPETPAEAETLPLASDVRFRFLSQAFFLLGLICIAFGSIWAWDNWTKLSTYPATADAKVSKAGRYYTYVPLPGPPIGPQYVKESHVKVCYDYIVDGQVYHAQDDDAEGDYFHAIIHYDPSCPQKCLLGPIAPPWVVLLFAFGIAGFMSFVGYQFR